MSITQYAIRKPSLVFLLFCVAIAPPAFADKFIFRVAAPGIVGPLIHPIISLSAMSLTSGDIGGGMTLSISGNGLSEASSVMFGTTPGVVTAVGNTSLAVTVPAALAVGSVPVTVGDAYGQRVSVPGSFSYTDVLGLASGSPLTGFTSGGTQVTLTGTFSGVSDETFWIGGNPAVVTSWSNPFGAVVVTAPAGAAGNAAISVKRGSRTRVLPSNFSYTALLGVSSVAYLTQTPAGTTKLPPQGGSIQVQGTDFDSTTRVYVGAGGAIVPTAVTPTSLTFLAPAGTAGTSANVRVETLPQTYTAVNALSYVAPAISDVSPNTGSTLGGLLVTVSGSNFLPGATVKFGGTLGATPVVSADGLTITVKTPASMVETSAGVVVTNPGGTSILNPSKSFTYVLPTQNIAISSSSANYNLRSVLGTPTSSAKYVVTISSGVVLSSTSTSLAAFDTGNLPVGSKVTIINNGAIIGMGGIGGYNPAQGGNGGPALSTSFPLTVDNTGGYIFGGGGGGGGAGNGCGGGGGAGGGAGSAGGSRPGGMGSTGISGTGGSGGSDPAYGEYGGIGGDYGMAGQGGSYDHRLWEGAGGTGGNAVRLVNGATITWVAGNTAAKVKGAVN